MPSSSVRERRASAMALPRTAPLSSMASMVTRRRTSSLSACSSVNRSLELGVGLERRGPGAGLVDGDPQNPGGSARPQALLDPEPDGGRRRGGEEEVHVGRVPMRRGVQRLRSGPGRTLLAADGRMRERRARRRAFRCRLASGGNRRHRDQSTRLREPRARAPALRSTPPPPPYTHDSHDPPPSSVIDSGEKTHDSPRPTWPEVGTDAPHVKSDRPPG